MAGKNTDRTRIGPRVQRILKAVIRNGMRIKRILKKENKIGPEVKSNFHREMRTGGAVEPRLDQVTRRDTEQEARTVESRAVRLPLWIGRVGILRDLGLVDAFFCPLAPAFFFFWCYP